MITVEKPVVRNADTDFDKIVDGFFAEPSMVAQIVDASGIEIAEFSEDKIVSVAESIDAGHISDIETQFDEDKLEAEQVAFLGQRAIDYATAAPGDPDYIG